MTVRRSISVEWAVDVPFEISLDFQWNVGSSTLFWYQVEGECITATCETASVSANDAKCDAQRYILTVPARSVEDLCRRLKQRSLNYPLLWPIKSVKRHSRPASLDDIRADEVLGISHECDELVSEPFCHVPECAMFCLSETPHVTAGARVTVEEGLHNHVGSGGITLSGSVGSYQYVGGTYAPLPPTFFYTSSGSPLALGGSAGVSGYSKAVSGTGGITLRGFASASSPGWHYTPTGGITLGGSYTRLVSYVGSGGVALSGSGVGRFILKRTGSGGILLAGHASASSPDWHYVPSGGVTLSGSGAVASSWQGEYQVTAGAFTSLLAVEVFFATETGVPLPVADADSVTTPCGCGPLPRVLFLSHNLSVGNSLSSFLARNGYTLPVNLEITYNSGDGVWRTTHHFRGDGSSGSERWDLVFEWGCVDTLGGTPLDTFVWKFSVSATKTSDVAPKNLTTRIVAAFDGNSVCSGTGIDFSFSMHTQQEGAVTTRVPAVVHQTILYDGVALFRNPFWQSKPDLKVRVFGNAPRASVDRFDVSPAFPVSTTIELPSATTFRFVVDAPLS